MATAAAVDSEALKAIGALIDAMPADRPVSLDPSNKAHRAALEAAFAGAGRLAQRYPGLHGRLADAGSQAPDHVALIDHGSDPSGRATAMSVTASRGTPLYMGSTIFALHGETGALLALGHNSNVGEGFVPVSTDTATAQPVGAGTPLKTLTVSHSVAQDGKVRFTALASKGVVSMDGGASIMVFQPTQTPKKPPNLIIALGRDSQHSNADADYVYTEPYNLDTPYLIVPFVGMAKLPYPVVGQKGAPITGARLNTLVYYVAGGTTTPVPLDPKFTPADRLQQAVTLSSDDQYTMSWNYPADGNSFDTTSSLVYGQESQANEQIAYFLYTFQIPVQGPNPWFSFAVCSVGTPNEPTYQCKQVPAIMFWWHCLAAGTKITLADGGSMPIEALTNDHRVATGTAGASLGVEATARGRHAAAGKGPQAVYRLVTAGGRTLVATGQHAIATPDGLAAVADLRRGDAVRAEDGLDHVEAIEAIECEGMFHNLKLGDEHDRAAGRYDDATAATYVANGIVVGDHLAMVRHYRRRVRDLGHMAGRIPKAFAADYAAAVEDIRY